MIRIRITKLILYLCLLLTSFLLFGCDMIYNISVSNLTKKAEVVVVYSSIDLATFFDTDTLNFLNRKAIIPDKFLIRHNIDSSKYSFVMPENSEVDLQPKSIGTPIKKIIINFEKDSTLIVDLYDRKYIRKLRKLGVLSTTLYSMKINLK